MQLPRQMNILYRIRIDMVGKLGKAYRVIPVDSAKRLQSNSCSLIKYMEIFQNVAKSTGVFFTLKRGFGPLVKKIGRKKFK